MTMLVARPDFRLALPGSWYVYDPDAGIILRDGFASQAHAEEWISHDDPMLRDITRCVIRRVWSAGG